MTRSVGIAQMVGRVRRRVRVQRALDGLVSFGLAACGALAAWLAAYKLGLVSDLALGLVALSMPLVGAAWGACRRIEPLLAAQLIDRSHQLHDRLASALSFSAVPEAQRSAFMSASIRDAERRLSGLDPRQAKPLRPPRHAATLAVLALALVGLGTLQVRAVQPPPAPGPEVHAKLLHDDDLAALEQRSEQLTREGELTPQLGRAAQELNTLLEQLADQKLERAEALEKLRALEDRLRKARPGDAERLQQALSELARHFETRPTRDLATALEQGDAAQAEQRLRQLAEDTKRSREEIERHRRQLQKALQRAARPSEKERREMAAQRRQLERQRRLLKRQQQQTPDSPRQRRLLERRKRELERLRRQVERAQERRRQLERLRRELDQAAEQLSQNDFDQASQRLERGAEQLNRMAREQLSQKQRQALLRQLSQLKELLRRGRQGSGDGEPKKRLTVERFVRQAEGEPGKGGDKGRRILKRGKGGDVIAELPQQEGDNNVMRRQPGARGDRAGSSAEREERKKPSELDSERVDTRVAGDKRAGPTRSEVILSASRRGFASRRYEKVYTDYENHAERVLERDQVPPGYRFYVRRYFQLIRPREEQP